MKTGKCVIFGVLLFWGYLILTIMTGLKKLQREDVCLDALSVRIWVYKDIFGVIVLMVTMEKLIVCLLRFYRFSERCDGIMVLLSSSLGTSLVALSFSCGLNISVYKYVPYNVVS